MSGIQKINYGKIEEKNSYLLTVQFFYHPSRLVRLGNMEIIADIEPIFITDEPYTGAHGCGTCDSYYNSTIEQDLESGKKLLKITRYDAMDSTIGPDIFERSEVEWRTNKRLLCRMK